MRLLITELRFGLWQSELTMTCSHSVRETQGKFELKPLLDTLSNELLTGEDVRTKMASLRSDRYVDGET
jgi:hypothetical protein